MVSSLLLFLFRHLVVSDSLWPLYFYTNWLLNCEYIFICGQRKYLWTAACQASLSFIVSQSLLKLMSVELMIPSNHLVLCHSLLLLPLIFPSIRWLEYWSFSFSISPSNEFSGLISFRMDLFDLLAVQGKNRYLYMYGWVPPQSTWNHHNIVNQLYSKIK